MKGLFHSSSHLRKISSFPVSLRSFPSSTLSILARVPSSLVLLSSSSSSVVSFSSTSRSRSTNDFPVTVSDSSYSSPYSSYLPHNLHKVISSPYTLFVPYAKNSSSFTRYYHTSTPYLSSSSSPSTSGSSSSSSSRGWLIGGIVLLAISSGGIGIYLTIQDRKASEMAYARPLVPGCPLVYITITDNETPIGRLVIQLRNDIVPITAENFRLLITNGPGYGYRGSALFGVEKARRVFGGDFYSTGNGNFSAYGGLFSDENFLLKHDGPGVVGMRNNGPNSNGSQFYITFRALPELDGRTVVVGHVVEGWNILELLDKEAKSDNSFGKKHEFRISECGEIKGKYTKIADTNMTKDEVDFINTLTMLGKESDKK